METSAPPYRHPLFLNRQAIPSRRGCTISWVTRTLPRGILCLFFRCATDAAAEPPLMGVLLMTITLIDVPNDSFRDVSSSVLKPNRASTWWRITCQAKRKVFKSVVFYFDDIFSTFSLFSSTSAWASVVWPLEMLDIDLYWMSRWKLPMNIFRAIPPSDEPPRSDEHRRRDEMCDRTYQHLMSW